MSVWRFASGQFQIEGADANGASKQGSINTIDIMPTPTTNGSFTLTGTVTPSSITISGDCKVHGLFPEATKNLWLRMVKRVPSLVVFRALHTERHSGRHQ
jgi:hypothetical protein